MFSTQCFYHEIISSFFIIASAHIGLISKLLEPIQLEFPKIFSLLRIKVKGFDSAISIIFLSVRVVFLCNDIFEKKKKLFM